MFPHVWQWREKGGTVGECEGNGFSFKKPPPLEFSPYLLPVTCTLVQLFLGKFWDIITKRKCGVRRL